MANATSNFQEKTIELVQRKLMDFDLESDRVEHMRPWRETTEPWIEIKVKSNKFSLWIYPNGAQIQGCRLDLRFEEDDYDNLNSLQAEYLSSLEYLLRKLRIQNNE